MCALLSDLLRENRLAGLMHDVCSVWPLRETGVLVIMDNRVKQNIL